MSTSGDITNELQAKEQPKATAEQEQHELRSQADRLVEFATCRAELFHDHDGNCYAKNHDTGETRRLDSRAYKDWLCASFYRAEQKSVKSQSLIEALCTLSALARFDGSERQVFLRVAKVNDSYFIDLCEPGNSRAIQWSAAGWEVIDRPNVIFVRTEAMQPLPVPISGGSLEPLWNICNIPEKYRYLIIAWLIDSIRTDTPFTGLELTGEQGSGKSTTAEAIRKIIDPNTCNLRAAAKTVEDIFVSAGANYIVAYENLSHLSPAMQDALCILATGGGFAKRKLYSDADESVINVQRPCLLNGICPTVTQQDLLDRTISIECPVISNRLPSAAQWEEFERCLPSVLGALLNLACAALAKLPNIRIEPADRPRMVEYCSLGMAITSVINDSAEHFLRLYQHNRKKSISSTIDASPVCTAVIEMLEHRSEINAPVKDILTILEQHRPERCEAWPRSPKGLGDALRRAAPALRHLGIECRSLGKSGGSVSWSIKKNLPGPSPLCPEVLEPNAEISTSGHAGLVDQNYTEPQATLIGAAQQSLTTSPLAKYTEVL